MRAWIAGAVIAAGLMGSAVAAEPDHGAWDTLVNRYVAESADGVSRVDYARWKAAGTDRAALTGYIQSLETVRPGTLSRAEQFAYWANLYNAVTVDTILARYPVASIRDIRSEGISLKGLIGPWQTKKVTVDGRRLSLDEIENAIMRPTFRDPRVHYALNCASIGCPNLQRHAFRAATLEADLDAAARAYINHPRGVRTTPQGLRLSSIFTWYKADFGTPAELRAHLERYAAPALATQIRATPTIAGYGYDWALNGAATSR
jgi:hypothetical protein